MSTQSKTTKAAPKSVAPKTAAPKTAAPAELTPQTAAPAAPTPKTAAPAAPTLETVEQAVEAATEQVEKARAAVTQGYGDFAAFQQEAFAAFVRSGEILAKGAEALSKEYFAFAQHTAEANSEAAKALLAAKSVNELVQLQSEFLRVSLDKSVDEGSKLSEMSFKIASEAFEPLQKQMTAAVEAGMKPLST